MELKQIRNQANHAGEDDNRYSIDGTKGTEAYVELYEKIERKITSIINFSPPTAPDGTAGGVFLTLPKKLYKTEHASLFRTVFSICFLNYPLAAGCCHHEPCFFQAGNHMPA